jgi:hypothetical protein
MNDFAAASAGSARRGKHLRASHTTYNPMQTSVQ